MTLVSLTKHLRIGATTGQGEGKVLANDEISVTSSSSEGEDDDSFDTSDDLYHQRHPKETPEMRAEGLSNLEAELSKISAEKKVNWLRALKECPDQIDDGFKLKFLRCEVFNADLAAARIINFWNLKVDLFGEDKAFLPLTVKNLFGDSESSDLHSEATRIVSAKDQSGRGILMVDPSKVDTSKHSHEYYRRANFYVLWSIVQDETIQKKGIVVLFYPPNAELKKFDRILLKKVLGGMKGTMPVRMSVFHVCKPPTYVRIVLPLFKLLLGSRLRQRIKFHTGSKANILKKLQAYEMSADTLPTELGGNIVLDQRRWIQEQLLLNH